MKKKKGAKKWLPFLWWCPTDFNNSTRGWPRIAKHAYRDLLDLQWDRGIVPENETDMARVCDLPIATFRRHWKERIEDKFKHVHHGYQNRRMARQRVEAKSFHVERSDTGFKGAEAKKNKNAPQHVIDLMKRLQDKKKDS